MAVYLTCIVLMLAGGLYLTSADSYQEFETCRETATKDCTNSNPTFTKFETKIDDFFLKQDDNYCAKKNDLSQLLICYNSAQVTCLDAGYQNLLPTVAAMNETLNYYCERLTNNYNFTCLMAAESKVAECIKAAETGDMETMDVNRTIADWKVSHCRRIELRSECYGDHLKDCPDTKETLMEIMMKVKPEGCSGTAVFYNSLLLLFSLYIVKFFM